MPGPGQYTQDILNRPKVHTARAEKREKLAKANSVYMKTKQQA